MTLKLNGSSSGYTAIDAPATAGSNTLVLPPNNGSANQILQTDGSGNLTWVDKPSSIVTTTMKTLSGENSVEWTLTGNVKKIDLQMYKVSHNGAAGNTYNAILLGDSGGYAGSDCYDNVQMNIANSNQVTGSSPTQSRLTWCKEADAADNNISGYATFRLVGTVSGNDVWQYDQAGADDGNNQMQYGTGFCDDEISSITKVKFFLYNNSNAWDGGYVSLSYWTA